MSKELDYKQAVEILISSLNDINRDFTLFEKGKKVGYFKDRFKRTETIDGDITFDYMIFYEEAATGVPIIMLRNQRIARREVIDKSEITEDYVINRLYQQVHLALVQYIIFTKTTNNFQDGYGNTIMTKSIIDIFKGE